MKQSYFSGGRVLSLKDIFTSIPGVINIEGGTSHYNNNEMITIEVTYNEDLIAYDDLIERYIKHIDFTDHNGQFSDRGNHYQPVIYYQNEVEKTVILNKIDTLLNRFKGIALTYGPLISFSRSNINEEIITKEVRLKHEMTVRKEKRYEKIASLWKDTYHDQIKKLDPLAFEVTKHNHTERPFTSSFSKGNKPGIYVDVISNEPLFSTIDQYDAGCGWPSFTKPITALVEKHDFSYGMNRVEIRSVHSDSHLGHVFDDGPRSKGGLRYCINGTALRFIPYEDLEKEGFKAYKALFQTNL